jgi:SAM-dependent methyltransferase
VEDPPTDDGTTDGDEVVELLTERDCLLAPTRLIALLDDTRADSVACTADGRRPTGGASTCRSGAWLGRYRCRGEVGMPTAAPYDEIADWYETVFLAGQRAQPTADGFADRLGIDRALTELLGPGRGGCLEVGCGTGVYASRIRRLGWTPVGVDLSTRMLGHATTRLPVACADAARLPVADASLDAVVSVMVHTDLADYRPVLAEVWRVLRPGGRFVHIGVHPCFCGGFADRTDPQAIVVRSGYLDGSWTTDSWTDQGIRDKVGASHIPVATLINIVLDSGFELRRLTEGGEPTPVVLSLQAHKPSVATQLR